MVQIFRLKSQIFLMHTVYFVHYLPPHPPLSYCSRSLSRKTVNVGESLILYRRCAFQTDQPATAKARSDNLVRRCGTTTVVSDAERSPDKRRWRNNVTDVGLCATSRLAHEWMQFKLNTQSMKIIVMTTNNEDNFRWSQIPDCKENDQTWP